MRPTTWNSISSKVIRGVCALLLMASGGCGGSQQAAMPDPLSDVSGEDLFERGIAYAQGGDPQRAEQYLVASMEKGMARTVVVPRLAAICIGTGRFSAALAYVRPVLREHPELWRLRRLAGSIQHGLGEVELAREAYERVLQSHDDALTHYFLGQLYLEDFDDRSKATEHLSRYAELEPEGEHVAEVRETLTGLSRPRIEQLPRQVPADPAESTPAEPSEASEPALEEREPT